jgi:hypothetical protein
MSLRKFKDKLPILAEVVLPSGRFATMVSPILVMDILAANASGIDPMTVLVHRCVLIDGETISLDDLLKFEISEYFPLVNMLGVQINKANKTSLGVK